MFKTDSRGVLWPCQTFKQLHLLKPMNRFLDIGGEFGSVAQEISAFNPSVAWTVIEIWGLELKDSDDYPNLKNNLIVSDPQYIQWDKLGGFDCIMLGQVFNYMNPQEALALYAKALSVSQYVMVSLPVRPVRPVRPGNAVSGLSREQIQELTENFRSVSMQLADNKQGYYLATRTPENFELLQQSFNAAKTEIESEIARQREIFASCQEAEQQKLYGAYFAWSKAKKDLTSKASTRSGKIS